MKEIKRVSKLSVAKYFTIQAAVMMMSMFTLGYIVYVVTGSQHLKEMINLLYVMPFQILGIFIVSFIMTGLYNFISSFIGGIEIQIE